MTNKDFEDVKAFLKELKDDSQTPKNVRLKSEEVLNILEGEGEMSMNANKAINIFEELSEDTNLEAYTRTQIWNIASLLEKLC